MKKIAIAILLTTSCYSHSANHFQCEVKKVYKLNSEGKLVPKTSLLTPDVGSVFMVNRQSGQITGKGITNTMSGVMPKVYDVLPTENSYRALTFYPHTLDFIQINTYEETLKKTFIYKGAFGEVVTGLCKILI